ncbi:HupE/UreJ family protein [Neorhizobium sp. NCHU2750]|uniref:HupE/UreJ family protein n=1 Tax=Neorhizobium sp. NCHU2750 TaxID=1825976 RepID=UPI000E7643AE|nr:urease accessory protein [Neorhizobium sp. NCHU2750]
MIKRLSLSTAIFAAAAAPAFAHLNPNEHGSFMAGFSHPLFGMDHILVMVAVGLWASQLGRDGKRSALWIVPTSFVLTMAVGFALALSGVALPFVEPGILASVIALGLLVAMAVRMPTAICAAIVAVFALLHSHAHGGELGSAGALQFGAGFVIATATLHAAGIAAGLGISRFSPYFARILGAIIALLGVSLVFG